MRVETIGTATLYLADCAAVLHDTSGSWEAVHRQRDMRAEYKKAKPLAWDAARRALTQSDRPVG